MLMTKMKANSLSLVAEEEAVLAWDLVPGKDEFKKNFIEQVESHRSLSLLLERGFA